MLTSMKPAILRMARTIGPLVRSFMVESSRRAGGSGLRLGAGRERVDLGAAEHPIVDGQLVEHAEEALTAALGGGVAREAEPDAVLGRTVAGRGRRGARLTDL